MTSAAVDKYTGLTAEHFDKINKRYKAFLRVVNDVDTEPVKVFEPLTPKALAELELIRSISVDLQNKMDEDMKKAAQLKKEAEEAAVQKEKEEQKDGEEKEKEE